MTKEELRQKNRDELLELADDLTELPARPVAAIALGTGDKLGQVVFSYCDGLTGADFDALLAAVVRSRAKERAARA